MSDFSKREFRGLRLGSIVLAASVLCATEGVRAQSPGPRRAALFQGYLVAAKDCCPSSVAVGDVDPRDTPAQGPLRDRGRATCDLVFANNNDSVTVVLNEGNGTFGSERTYAVGDRPYTVALGDVSGDGLLDIVTSNWGGDSVTVLWNDGVGGFTARQDHAVGDAPRWMVLADADRDGALDIVTANQDAETVSVLLNQGGGSFSRTDYPIGARPDAIAAGDVDGDGWPDLAIASYDTDSVILLPNAGGMFLARQGYPVGMGPRSVALGDLDGDGALDIVTGEIGVSGGGAVSVLVNLGACAFGNPVAYPLADPVIAVALADLGSDGRLDVVAAVWPFGRGELVVLENLGGAVLGAPQEHPIGSGPDALVLADVSGDALPDAITVHGATVGYVAVIVNRGAGDFKGREDHDVLSPNEAQLADLTGDGWLDVVLVGGSIRVLPSAGGGAFGALQRYPIGVPSAADDAAFGDVDGDGAVDVVASFDSIGESSVLVLLNQGAGVFGPNQSYLVGDDAYGVALGDLDGDGLLDIATSNLGDDTVSVLTNAGGGVFGNRRDYAVGERPSQIVLADVNGDGLVDLMTLNTRLAASSPDTLTALLNQGAGVLGGRQDSIVGTSSSQDFEPGQVVGDSLPDVVIVNYGDPAGSVTVVRNDGGGKFKVVRQYAVGPRSQSLALGDVDGNGDLDFATANGGGDSITVWLNQGAGGFGERKEYTVGVTAQSVALGDVDGDGRLDAVTANYQSDSVTVLRQKPAARRRLGFR